MYLLNNGDSFLIWLLHFYMLFEIDGLKNTIFSHADFPLHYRRTHYRVILYFYALAMSSRKEEDRWFAGKHLWRPRFVH